MRETSFQGSDGYLMFGTPQLAAATVGRIAEAVLALGLGNRHVVRVQQTISSHHRRAAQAGDLGRLLDNEVALGLEDREEQQLRTTSSNLGQHRNHVGVALVDRREPGDRPATSLKRIGERLRQTLGVRIAVVDRRSSTHTEDVEGEVRRRRTLVQIVVRGAVVAGVVVRTRRARQVTGQSRRRVRTRDHHHPGLGDQRARSSRRTRTTRANHTDNGLVSHDRLGSRLATIS